MSFREDIDRLYALSNEVSDVRVSERLIEIARELADEEARRQRSDAEIEASDDYKVILDSFLRSGIFGESAHMAAKQTYLEMQRIERSSTT